MAQVTMEQAERLIKANVTEQHLFTHARGKRGNGRNGGAFRRG